MFLFTRLVSASNDFSTGGGGGGNGNLHFFSVLMHLFIQLTCTVYSKFKILIFSLFNKTLISSLLKLMVTYKTRI